MYKMYVLRLFDLCVSFEYLVGSLHNCLVTYSWFYDIDCFIDFLFVSRFIILRYVCKVVAIEVVHFKILHCLLFSQESPFNVSFLDELLVTRDDSAIALHSQQLEALPKTCWSWWRFQSQVVWKSLFSCKMVGSITFVYCVFPQLLLPELYIYMPQDGSELYNFLFVILFQSIAPGAPDRSEDLQNCRSEFYTQVHAHVFSCMYIYT